MAGSFSAPVEHILVESLLRMRLSGKKISHGLSCFFLCRGGDVGVGVQGEACGEVAEHAGYRLDIHAVLEGNGSKGVAEVMESDLRDALIRRLEQ